MITDAKDLEFALRRWGRAFGEAPISHDYDESDEAAPAGENTIAVAMLAAGSREVREAVEARGEHYGRTKSRLRILGASAGLLSVKGTVMPVPSWAVDPIRSPRQSGSPSGTSPRLDPISELVERAAIQLYGFDRILAVCLRIEYCTRGLRFREKVARAASCLDLRLPAREYRRALDRAKVWMAGRLA